MLSHLKSLFQGPMAALLILTLIALMWFSAGAGQSQVITPLHMAALNGESDSITRQLDAGADVDVSDSTRRDAAAPCGHDRTARDCSVAAQSRIENQCEGLGRPDAADLCGEDSRDDIVDLLLSAGADPTIADDAGRTPLHWAAQCRNVQSVDLLLAHHARTDVQNNDGETPLGTAIRFGGESVVRTLQADHKLSNQ